MSKNNFKFIKINPDYIKYLLQYDNKVQYNDIKLKKDNKPFLGVLFTINDHDYYVPLSSANKKKRLIKMHKISKKINKTSLDMVFIEDKNKKLLSVLNLNNMIPVAKNSIIEFNIEDEINYSLLQKEFKFCNKNKKQIIGKAIKLYSIVKNHTNENIEKRCCDFKMLEEKCEEYQKKTIIKV